MGEKIAQNVKNLSVEGVGCPQDVEKKREM